MPIYEYKCRDCGQQTEIIHKVNDVPPQTCEKCGGSLEKMLSVPAIQFKGSGWYITDYARKSAPAQDSEPKAGKDSESKTETKKPETKSETTASSKG